MQIALELDLLPVLNLELSAGGPGPFLDNAGGNAHIRDSGDTAPLRFEAIADVIRPVCSGCLVDKTENNVRIRNS